MNEREIERRGIIERLKLKNSIFGVAARSGLTDEQEEDLLNVCYQEAYTQSFQAHLEEELFNDLISYQRKYNNSPEIKFIN
jgi:hypothetical protein